MRKDCVMAKQVFPLFRANYVDYRGHLRWLTVESLLGRDGLLYFQCTIDQRDSYVIRMGEDARWHDRVAGPTVLADELGSIIESKLF